MQIAYKQSVIGVLNEIAPGLDIESRQKIAEKICWNRYGYSSIDEIILMHDGRGGSKTVVMIEGEATKVDFIILLNSVPFLERQFNKLAKMFKINIWKE